MDKQVTKSTVKPRCKECNHLVTAHKVRGNGCTLADGYCNIFGCLCMTDRQELEFGYGKTK